MLKRRLVGPEDHWPSPRERGHGGREQRDQQSRGPHAHPAISKFAQIVLIDDCPISPLLNDLSGDSAFLNELAAMLLAQYFH